MDEGLQASLNEKYLEENKALFEQFQQDVAEMKKAGDGHLGIDTAMK